MQMHTWSLTFSIVAPHLAANFHTSAASFPPSPASHAERPPLTWPSPLQSWVAHLACARAPSPRQQLFSCCRLSAAWGPHRPSHSEIQTPPARERTDIPMPLHPPKVRMAANFQQRIRQVEVMHPQCLGGRRSMGTLAQCTTLPHRLSLTQEGDVELGIVFPAFPFSLLFAASLFASCASPAGSSTQPVQAAQ